MKLEGAVDMVCRDMELKDTVNMMLSEDHKERFKAEYYQAVIRYKKLKKMLSDWDNGELKFKPTCPKSIYDMQREAMIDYIVILEARAKKTEGIDL